MNSVFNGLPQGNQIPQPTNQLPSQITPQMLQQFNEFKKNFKGDPKQMVMQLLQQNGMNGNQLQQAMQMVQQFQTLLKG